MFVAVLVHGPISTPTREDVSLEIKCPMGGNGLVFILASVLTLTLMFNILRIVLSKSDARRSEETEVVLSATNLGVLHGERKLIFIGVLIRFLEILKLCRC